MKTVDMHPQEWAPPGPASLFVLGALLIGIFAFTTGQVGHEAAPILGLWVVVLGAILVMLAMIDMRLGNVLFGTIGMVFGGLLGIGGGVSFLRQMWIPGISPMDGWMFLGGGIVLFLFLPAFWRASRAFFFALMEVGTAVIILALGLIGVFPSDISFKIAGWLVLFFAIFVLYAATAQLVNMVYEESILPI